MSNYIHRKIVSSRRCWAVRFDWQLLILLLFYKWKNTYMTRNETARLLGWNLLTYQFLQKKYLDYIKRQSLLIFVSCAPVGEFNVTCTCSHVQYANSALVTSKTDTTVHKAYQLSLSRVFFLSSWSFFLFVPSSL